MEAAIGSVKSYSGSFSCCLIGAIRFYLSIEPYLVEIANLYLELDVYLYKDYVPLSLLLFLLLNRLSLIFFSLKLALCYITSYIYCLVTFTTDIFTGDAALLGWVFNGEVLLFGWRVLEAGGIYGVWDKYLTLDYIFISSTI